MCAASIGGGMEFKMSKRKRLEVPESRQALDALKMECAQELGRSQDVKENHGDEYYGERSASMNGRMGGPIGGLMVKKMVESYKRKIGG